MGRLTACKVISVHLQQQTCKFGINIGIKLVQLLLIYFRLSGAEVGRGFLIYASEKVQRLIVYLDPLLLPPYSDLNAAAASPTSTRDK